MKKAKCNQCGHSWVPRKPISKIVECPKCKRYDWNKPKKKK